MIMSYNGTSVKAALLATVMLLGVASFYKTNQSTRSLATLQQPFSDAALPSQVISKRTLGGKAAYDEERSLLFGPDDLRVAAFGSSQTWGANLDSRFEAYPYRVSQTVDNYALFAGGPNYPSACLQSILGDEKVYDVILLEYWLRAKEGLEELAYRVRRRFPKAIIIFVKIWGPTHAFRKESEFSEEQAIPFYDWAASIDDQLLYHQNNEVIALLKNDTGFWFFPDHQRVDVHMNRIAASVDGYQVRMPHDDTAKESLLHYLRFYDPAHHGHLNPIGHSLLGNLTDEIMRYHMANQVADDQVNSAGKLGPWGLGDSCHLWMSTGACNLEYSDNFKVNEYDADKGKFALEMNGPGWIDVHNPFDAPRTLYLSFIATNIPNTYPVMGVSFIGADGKPVSRLLDPIHSPDAKQVGMIRTLPIGAIPATPKTRIQMAPQGPSEFPFRLVGASFSNDIAVPLEYNFGPMYNK